MAHLNIHTLTCVSLRQSLTLLMEAIGSEDKLYPQQPVFFVVGASHALFLGSSPLSTLLSFRLYTYRVHICKISSADANREGDRAAQLPSGPLCGCQGSAAE